MKKFHFTADIQFEAKNLDDAFDLLTHNLKNATLMGPAWTDGNKPLEFTGKLDIEEAEKKEVPPPPLGVCVSEKTGVKDRMGG